MSEGEYPSDFPCAISIYIEVYFVVLCETDLTDLATCSPFRLMEPFVVNADFELVIYCLLRFCVYSYSYLSIT